MTGNLGDLADVDLLIDPPTDGQVLTYSTGEGNIWINADPTASGGGGGGADQSPLTGNLDINEFHIVDGINEVIFWSGSPEDIVYIGGSPAFSVTETALASGDYIKYNGTDYINSPPLLDDITDVDVLGAVSGEYLCFDGADWINSTISAGTTDHGALSGLGDDDHEQYLLGDGTRPLSGTWAAGSYQATDLGTVMVQTGEPSTPATGQLWLDTTAVSTTIDRFPTTLVTGAYTAELDDSVILCNGTFTVTLPTVSGIPGKPYWIKNIGTGTITADGDGSELIEGSLTIDILASESRTLVGYSTAWYII
jgi:hypothetical protein